MSFGHGEVMPHRDPEAARKYRQTAYRHLKERDPSYGKRQYWKHREKRLAAKKAEREADIERARAYSRASYAKHREERVERAREYRRKNAGACAAKAMARYHANKEAICERRRELDKRPEARAKQYAHMRKWSERNPEKVALMKAKIIINEQTGVPIRDIPNEIAEVKVDQLKVSRLARELRAAGA